MIRQMAPSEYNEILLPWFAGHDWEPIPKDCIPVNSFILFENEKPLVFCNYYTSDSSMVILGHTITNPFLKVEDDKITELLTYVLNHVKNNGKLYIHYSTGRGGIGIVRKLKKLGMTVTCDRGYILGMAIERNNNIKFLQED